MFSPKSWGTLIDNDLLLLFKGSSFLSEGALAAYKGGVDVTEFAAVDLSLEYRFLSAPMLFLRAWTSANNSL